MQHRTSRWRGMRPRGVLLGMALVVWGVTGPHGFGVASPEAAEHPYNAVVIMTDDQRWDTLWAMPLVQEHLLRKGVQFLNAFVSTPQCCPARASFLAGGFYAHHTGVLTNDLPNGGAAKFDDCCTLPVLLQARGYTTALIGKYLNGFEMMLEGYVPPGWTQFDRRGLGATAIAGEALAFLDEVGSAPFFLYLAPDEPHEPAEPDAQDADLFPTYRYRDRAYGESNLRDKPAWVRAAARKYNPVIEDELHRNQLRSLQAVDRLVGAIVDKLRALGTLDWTMLVFTSDNGFMWGEHGLWAKACAYEESIRVPFVVVLPGMGIIPRQERRLVVANLDLPTTIFELAGIARETDGVSLLPLLKHPEGWQRSKEILLEAYEGTMFGVLPWAGLRTNRYKYVKYATGERELYDLREDPYELENQIGHPAYADIVTQLATRLEPLTGLAITVRQAPPGVVGSTYRFPVTTWGGRRPYEWALVQGRLPLGLTLDPATGRISGTPTAPGTYRVSIRVTDASVSPYTGEPQGYEQAFTISIRS